jgi:hypothetical protein
LEQLQPGNVPQDPKSLIQELLRISLPQLEKDLKQRQKDLEVFPAPAAAQAQEAAPPVQSPALQILPGQQKYTDIRVPILASVK